MLLKSGAWAKDGLPPGAFSISTVRIYDSSNGNMVYQSFTPGAVLWGPDDSTFLAGRYIRDTATGEIQSILPHILTSQSYNYYEVSWEYSHNLIASRDITGFFGIWDVEAQEFLYTDNTGAQSPYFDLAWRPNSTQIAIVIDGKVTIRTFSF